MPPLYADGGSFITVFVLLQLKHATKWSLAERDEGDKRA